MTVLLGGRVAEQIVFGAITTGASDDLKRVADISHSMVHDYAMGTAGVGRSPDGDVRAVRDDAANPRRGAPGPDRGGPPGRAEAHPRPPRPARRARARAARARGPRARLDRTDHGGRAADGARARGGAAGRRRGGPGRAARPGRAPISPRDGSGEGAPDGYRLPARVQPHRPHRSSRRGARARARALPRQASTSRSPTARSSRSRASRRCCSTSARTTSSCSRRWARTRPSAVPCPSGSRACTTWPTRCATSRRRSSSSKQGLQLIDEQPRIGIRGSRVAFMHPRATAGVLTEIVEPAAGVH